MDHQARTREIEARLAEATPGPWTLHEGDTWWDVRDADDDETVVATGHEGEVTVGIEDARLIAAAPADLRYLLDRVRALEAALEPFAGRAREFDERVYPPEHDGAGVSVRLGELRAAARLLPAPETVETQG